MQACQLKVRPYITLLSYQIRSSCLTLPSMWRPSMSVAVLQLPFPQSAPHANSLHFTNVAGCLILSFNLSPKITISSTLPSTSSTRSTTPLTVQLSIASRVPIPCNFFLVVFPFPFPFLLLFFFLLNRFFLFAWFSPWGTDKPLLFRSLAPSGQAQVQWCPRNLRLRNHGPH